MKVPWTNYEVIKVIQTNKLLFVLSVADYQLWQNQLSVKAE